MPLFSLLFFVVTDVPFVDPEISRSRPKLDPPPPANEAFVPSCLVLLSPTTTEGDRRINVHIPPRQHSIFLQMVTTIP